VSVKEITRRLNIVVSEPLHQELTLMAEKSEQTKSDFVRQAVEREIERRKDAALEKAAEELASLYETDEELLAFTSLDGEEFL
jgi:predicted transcriptional regulator